MARTLWTAFLLLIASKAWGQVGVDIRFERRDFLLFEPIELQVRITNYMSEPIDMSRMSGGGSWLDFYVTANEDEQIDPTEKQLKVPQLMLLPGEMKTVTVDLLPRFLLREPGEYQVVAEVTHRGKTVNSKPAKFTISNSPSIWQQEYTAPADSKDPNKEVRPRLYSLHIHGVKQTHMLYLRIQNPEAHRVYCTTPLGDVVNYGDPKARIDRQGNIHILHQSGTRIFTYTSFSPNGKNLSTRFFSNVSSNPVMFAASDDETMVVGGEELFEKDDKVEQVIPTAPLARSPSQDRK